MFPMGILDVHSLILKDTLPASAIMRCRDAFMQRLQPSASNSSAIDVARTSAEGIRRNATMTQKLRSR
jgi:hypothetical protein